MNIQRGISWRVTLAVMMACLWAGGVFAEERQGDPYPLNTCPVSGKELGAMGDPITKVFNGREVKFCCAGCEKPFAKDLAKSFAEIDKQIIAQQKDVYPLSKCVVGEKGDVDPAVDMVYNNRLVRFCCEKCQAGFKKDPAKFLSKLDEAVIEAQKADYPLTACPGSGKPLTESSIDYVVANRLVRLCCEGCKKKVDANPAKVIAQLDAAK